MCIEDVVPLSESLWFGKELRYVQNDYKKSNVGEGSILGTSVGGGRRETTSVSDRWRSFVRSGFELVVEGLAYFRLTRIRNRPFRLEKGASEMAQSLFGERGVVHFG